MSEQENLELQIKTYDSNYRAGQPLCTNEVYDKLVEELAEKFPNSILLKKGVIEQSQKESRKRPLPIPMFSLNKVKTIEEIKQWLKSNDITEDEALIITPKYDGISLVVNEANAECLTRGDGEVGQISTLHFSKMPVKTLGEQVLTFGEAIISKKNFEKHKERYANARNMVAGLFNRDIPTEELNDVDYMRYGSSEVRLSKFAQLEALNELNSKEVPFIITAFVDIENGDILEDLYQEWSKDYQIDGLVIDINSAATRKQLGREENMNPKYARAYKNPSWSGAAEVKVTGVTWQVSKQGKLKPVIQIEPTEVSGVTITNVTGYNAKYVIDNDIAAHSIIKIIRSGDVVPKHIETLSHIPEHVYDLCDEISECPSCGEPTYWDETMTEKVCTNQDCKEIRVAKLVHFFSTLEVEEFGEPSIRTFYEEGYDTIEKILNMKQFNIVNIEGFGAKSSVKLLSQFNKLKTEGVSLAKLLHALDVFNGMIGEKMCQKIVDEMGGDSFDFRAMVENISSRYKVNYISKLVEIDRVAEKTAYCFQNGIVQFYSNMFQNTPVKIKYLKTPKPKVTGDKLKGERICYTGCRPSKEMEEKIQNQGGELASGVSKNTTILIVKDMSDKTLSSTKARKAKQLGIKIIEQRKFEV